MARIRKAVLFLSMFLMAQMAMTEKIEFVNTVGPSGTTCFLENIGESIQAVVQVKSDTRNLILTITDPRGKRIESLRDELEYRHHFAAFYSGNYQICIQNTNS